MNWAYFHLFLNHFPIIGVLIGTFILIAGMIYKNQGVTMSGLGTIIFAALTSILAYLTGEPAEKAVKGLPDVAQSLINRHEDIATIGMYLLIPAGLLASVAFYSLLKKEGSVRFLLIVTLAMSIVSSAGMVYTGLTGGQIRHSEFRDAATNNYVIEHKNDTIDEDE